MLYELDSAVRTGRGIRRVGGLVAVRTTTKPLTLSMNAAQSLLERVATGDAEAVQACLDRFGGIVWTLARRLLRTTSDAEDAVQDIFIEIWKNAGRYNPSMGSEATFVTVIARRRLIDRLRRTGRDPQHAAVDTMDEFGSECTAPCPAELTEESERARQAMSTLKPDQRKVLRMAVFDGLTHQEISTHLNMPLGTVKTNVRRGLSRIRELLKTAPRRSEVNS